MRTLAMFALAVAAAAFSVAEPAQSSPSKPVRIVTNEAGAGLDFALRLMTPMALTQRALFPLVIAADQITEIVARIAVAA